MVQARKSQSSVKFKDDKGNAIILDKELGRGGEGSVYLVKGEPNVVAKIYKDEVLTKHSKAGKIKAMCALYDNEIAKFSALPQRVIYNSHGKVVGFIMEKVTDFKEIHNLYGITTKRKLFDFADYGFVVHAAKNLACAVDTLHKKNIVVGDINQGNILVDNQAMIKLIDCDSYQVEYNNKFYLCEVGVPEYTSPELQGRSFNGINRTFNHDGFGLAVMIFQILMFGRHPYSGFGAPPEIEKSITQGCYCYGKNAKGLTKIYSKLASVMLSDEIKEMFERAFAKGKNVIRPTAEEWINALEKFENSLVKCSKDGKHLYNPDYGKCAWCEFEALGFSPYNIPINPPKPKKVQTPYKSGNYTHQHYQPMNSPYLNPNYNTANPYTGNSNYKQNLHELLPAIYIIIAIIIGVAVLNSNNNNTESTSNTQNNKYSQEQTNYKPTNTPTAPIGDMSSNPKNAPAPSLAPSQKSSNNTLNTSKPNIDNLREPDFGPYMQNIQSRIKANWDPPKEGVSKQITAMFKIAKDGRLLDCHIVKSSGSYYADEAALKAIKNTAPFRPLPADFKGQSVDIQFTFDLNVYDKNHQKINSTPTRQTSDLEKSSEDFFS